MSPRYTPSSPPPRRESDVLFFRHEAGPRLVYDASRVRKVEEDLMPKWGMHLMHLRGMKLHEVGSLKDHIIKMMAIMNEIEYIDPKFNRDFAVDLLLESLPYTYDDFRKEVDYYERRSWNEMINLLRRYEATGEPERIRVKSKKFKTRAEMAKDMKRKAINPNSDEGTLNGIKENIDPYSGFATSMAPNRGKGCGGYIEE